MRKFKIFIAAVTAFVIALCFSLTAFARLPDLEEWNQCRKYTILPGEKETNSAVTGIVLRVKQEEDSNRLHFLFLANLESIEDEAQAGISLDFGDIGTVTLMCDGTSDYDTDVFFAEIDSTMIDEMSGMLTIELTVGIKTGIPDNLVLDFSIYDTSGIASNMYSVDLSDEISGEDAEITEQTDKTLKQKTTKQKTTKLKTTKTKKSKTTKVKTTNKKTTKSKNASETEVSTSVISSDEFDNIEIISEKNRLITICAIAVIACAAGGCTVGIINSRKKNGRGDN